MAGKMPLKATAVAGVGEQAVWQDTLHEFLAQKGGLLCDIQVRGAPEDLALAPPALRDALGAWCNEIFAAI